MLYLATIGVPILIVAAMLTALGVWFGGAWFRFLQYHRHKDLPLPDGPTWGRRLQHWISEADALVRIHAWRLARGPGTLAPPSDPGVRPVLCVHGFTQDRTNFAALRRRLWTAGRPSVSVDLGLPGRHPSAFADKVCQALEAFDQAYPDHQVDVVCHSMGGLVLRDAVKRRPDLALRIHTVITLGSPHSGTAAARGPLRWWPEADGLARGSAWIAGLPTLAELLPEARTVTVAGTADYIVYPASTCHLPGSEAVDLHGVGHAGLLTRSDVLDLIMAILRGEPVPARSSRNSGGPLTSATDTPRA